MHDELFEKPDIVARYRAGPYVEARERFLRQARAEGYSRSTLKRIAWVLLIVAEAVHNHGGRISIDQLEKLNLERSAGQWAATVEGYGQAVPSFRRGLAAQHRRSAARGRPAASVRSRAGRVHGVHARRARSLAGDNRDARRAHALVLLVVAVAGSIARAT